MRDKVTSIRKMKAYRISLTLAADNGRQNIKQHRQIGNYGFGSGETMLNEIEFSVMQNIIMNNEFKEFRKVIENRNGSIIIIL
jgi:2-hydroxy-3-keto-5-methylthiopentenyl-1-phosphate phosphatase